MRSGVLTVVVLLSACGGRTPPPQTAKTPVVNMEELRITARKTQSGGYELESYDAESLFQKAIALVRAGKCQEGVALYDRVATEFSSSRFASASLYNAGLCLQQEGRSEEAASRYARLIEELPRSSDVKHASLQLVGLQVKLSQWSEALEQSEILLKRSDLEFMERLEALARRAQALLGLERLDEAEAQGNACFRYYRGQPEEAPIADEFFAAACGFVIAEVYRLKSEKVEIPQGTVEQQHAALEARAQWILRAQRAYFDTMALKNAHWAAAAGYRIGSMYDHFWASINEAPIPPPLTPFTGSDLEVYREEYRAELKRLAQPLLRHAVRYWELTLLMIERTGTQSEWTERARTELEQVRERLLEIQDL